MKTAKIIYSLMICTAVAVISYSPARADVIRHDDGDHSYSKLSGDDAETEGVGEAMQKSLEDYNKAREEAEAAALIGMPAAKTPDNASDKSNANVRYKVKKDLLEDTPMPKRVFRNIRD